MLIDTPYTDNYLRENFTKEEAEKVGEILAIQKKEIMLSVNRKEFNQLYEDQITMNRRFEEMQKALAFSTNQWNEVVTPQTNLFEKND